MALRSLCAKDAKLHISFGRFLTSRMMWCSHMYVVWRPTLQSCLITSLPPALLLSAYCLWVICCSLVSTSHVEWSHELQIWQMLIYRVFLSYLLFLTSSVLIGNTYIVWDASHVVDCSFFVSRESIHRYSPFEFSEQDNCCYSVSMMMWLTWSLIPVVGGVRPAIEHFLPY